MIVKDNEALARINSPLNLINRMNAARNNQRSSAMSLFIPSIQPAAPVVMPTQRPAFNPFENKTAEPVVEDKEFVPLTEESAVKLGDIISDHDAKIQLGLAHDKAITLLNKSVEMLSTKLDDVSASKLPSVIAAASKTIESIRRERLESTKLNKDREVHYHFYTPQQKKVTDYEVIEVTQ